MAPESSEEPVTRMRSFFCWRAVHAGSISADYRFTAFPKPDVGERCTLCPIARKNANALFLEINRKINYDLSHLSLEPSIIEIIANSLEVSGDVKISPPHSVSPTPRA